MLKRIIYVFSFIVLGLLVLNSKLIAQNNTAAFSAADSSRFSVNKDNGWQLFNSYITQFQTDSAKLELIVQHNNNISWVTEQYIGKIKLTALQPKTVQTILFSLLNDYYQLRIDTNGKCYLKFMYGTLPANNPVVMSIKLLYKFN